MSRFLLICLGLVLGLALAGLSEGRMAHLRLVSPQILPAWTAPVTDVSTVWRGQASVLRPGVLPGPVDLRWRFERVEAAGPVWAIAVTGAGVEARGELALTWARDRVEITGLSGDILLSDLPALIGGVVQSGLLRVERLRAEIGWPERQLRGLGGAVMLTNGQLGPVEIATGEAVLVSDRAGGWRVPLSLSGPVLRAEGTLEGMLGAPSARLDLRVSAVGDLPEETRRALTRIAEPDGEGWRIGRDLESLADWPVF
jgi:hypothetical protein